MVRVLLALCPLLLIGCASAPASQRARTPKPAVTAGDENKVLVIVNQSFADSEKIANYYMQKRKIPAKNRLNLRTVTTDNVPPNQFEADILSPIKKFVEKNPNIEYIVFTKGTPIRILDDGGNSVDAMVAAMNLDVAPVKMKVGSFGFDEDPEPAFKRTANPFYGSKERFSRAKHKLFLVTRLTGYTFVDVIKLIDNSLNAKPLKGPILLDSQPRFGPGSGYWVMEESMAKANMVLTQQNLDVYFEKTENFTAGKGKLMGYSSWGSNDAKFDPVAYSQLRFFPGAIAETFVSTSGRTFDPTTGGQSLIADLIKQGVTGVKGYVSEPFTIALCRSEILFDRYWNGFNLAESFYAASPLIKWKDIVIGDPLCRPFKSSKF